MNASEKKYRRLPGRRRKTLGKDTLWASSDHLLLVESSGMSETYRRFYYKDIKSLLLARTNTAFYKTLFSLVCWLGFLGLGVFIFQDDMNPAAGFFWSLSAIFFVYFLICLAGGASCECWIVTAVQKEKLSSCVRLRPSLKAVDFIKQKIASVQGTVDRESLSAFEGGHEMKTHTSPILTLEDKPLAKVSRAWHASLFAGLIVTGVLVGWTLFYRPYPLFVLRAVLFALLGIVTVVALVRQSGSDISPMAKRLTWAGMALVLLTFAVNYAKTMYLMFDNIESIQPGDQMAMIKLGAQMNPFDYPVFLTMDCVRIGASVLLGLWGLALIQRRGRS